MLDAVRLARDGAAAATALARDRVPREIEFVDEPPRNAQGKVVKLWLPGA